MEGSNFIDGRSNGTFWDDLTSVHVYHEDENVEFVFVLNRLFIDDRLVET